MSALAQTRDDTPANAQNYAGDALILRLKSQYAHLDGEDLIRAMIREFPGRLALTSSFGVEAAVLLDIVAELDPSLPVIFLDTGVLFPETLDYRQQLVRHLGLRNVRDVRPDPDELASLDPNGALWKRSTNACCAVRKVIPLENALGGFDAWITGRKRVHGSERSNLPAIEWDGGHIKVNPLAHWSQSRIDATFEHRGLPRHPLQSEGYTSVGCTHCTARPVNGEDQRSGRWAGQEKTECGIHKAPWYREAAE
ncbi:MAG: phosphoadenylyl-sulfate reductase [Rhodospirillales bacterium]|nr:phosphoadenylyl-sulfate reductase [Rhodospirillales bacterium]